MLAAPSLLAPTFSTLVDASETLGPLVGDLSTLAGLPPDPEQQLVLDQLFAVDQHGRPSAFETGLIAPRQNLKTGLAKMAALGWLYITEERLVIWSSHEFKTTMEAFRDIVAMIESTPDLEREVQIVRRGSGSEAIELTRDRRLVFKARTKGAGRGLTGDKVILDEAYALHPMHVGAILPTMAARPGAQILYGSSAGMVDSEVLRDLRDRGRTGTAPRLAYLEWGDPNPNRCGVDGCEHRLGAPGCALDDPERLARVNTALGRRITLETLQAMRHAMPPEEFAREFLGWWDEPDSHGPDIEAAAWQSLETDDAPEAPLHLGVDVAPNQAWASIVVCGAGVLELIDRRRGTAWLPDRLADLVATHRPASVTVDPAGPVGVLLGDFDRLGIDITLLERQDSVRACGALSAAIVEQTVRHRGEVEFAAALAGSSRRAVGDGWKWSRKDSTVDISPLVAATWAHWSSTQDDYGPAPIIHFV